MIETSVKVLVIIPTLIFQTMTFQLNFLFTLLNLFGTFGIIVYMNGYPRKQFPGSIRNNWAPLILPYSTNFSPLSDAIALRSYLSIRNSATSSNVKCT